MTGRRFGRLTCTGFAGSDDNGMARWHVHCDCGTDFVAYRINLIRGATRSCGCSRRKTTTP